ASIPVDIPQDVRSAVIVIEFQDDTSGKGQSKAIPLDINLILDGKEGGDSKPQPKDEEKITPSEIDDLLEGAVNTPSAQGGNRPQAATQSTGGEQDKPGSDPVTDIVDEIDILP
ncbi:MAG: hypothetical protein KDD70_18980, partial [Bdellovibrionales bacterium]|nr:hypothetical protein [Bdellovibrionales bacterium]